MSEISANRPIVSGFEQQTARQQAVVDATQRNLDILAKQTEVMINGLNKSGFTMNGKPLQCDSIAEWKAALQSPGLGYKDQGPPVIEDQRRSALQHLNNLIPSLQSGLAMAEQAQFNLTALQMVTDTDYQPITAMTSLLVTGDVEGAAIALQASRVRTLNEELQNRASALEQRGRDLKTLTDDLAKAQDALSRDRFNPELLRQVEDLKTKVGHATRETESYMRGVRYMTDRRDEALGLLTAQFSQFQDRFRLVAAGYDHS
jgi:hypothetical protein